jgi:hypothetical protein
MRLARWETGRFTPLHPPVSRAGAFTGGTRTKSSIVVTAIALALSACTAGHPHRSRTTPPASVSRSASGTPSGPPPAVTASSLVRLRGEGEAIVAAGRNFWITLSRAGGRGELEKLDPATASVTKHLLTVANPAILASGGSELWIGGIPTGGPGSSPAQDVWRQPLPEGRPARFSYPGLEGIAADPAGAYIATQNGNHTQISRLAANGRLRYRTDVNGFFAPFSPDGRALVDCGGIGYVAAILGSHTIVSRIDDGRASQFGVLDRSANVTLTCSGTDHVYVFMATATGGGVAFLPGDTHLLGLRDLFEAVRMGPAWWALTNQVTARLLELASPLRTLTIARFSTPPDAISLAAAPGTVAVLAASTAEFFRVRP